MKEEEEPLVEQNDAFATLLVNRVVDHLLDSCSMENLIKWS